MTILRNTLYGPVDIEELAIELLKKYEPKEGYYVAFSGGKDSIVILDLVRRANVKHDTHFHRTTIDPPEVIEYIKTNYPDVIREKPKNSMYKIIIKKGFPPTRERRYCCSLLKEIGGKNRTVVLGIRKEESASRRERKEYEQSTVIKSKWFVNPILEWSTADIWKYIEIHSLPYCSLYKMGYSRIGCIMCPLQGQDGMLKDAERFPKHYQAFINTFDKMLKLNRIDKQKYEYEWKTAEDVMYWWIYGKNKKPENTVQTEIISSV